MNLSKLTRKNFLKTLGLASVGLISARRAEARNRCGVTTPEQPEGPFYPIKDQHDTDTNLIEMRGRRGQALGQYIIVRGRVVDSETCRPISGAKVEIWQACATGRYNHPEDPNNTVPLDPNFQYWGIDKTKSDGSYVFKTIRPGAYPADPRWTRPPHIHFKVTAEGYSQLVTQMYFEGDPLNDADQILQNLSREQQKALVVRFSAFEKDRRFLIGEFEISLSKDGLAGTPSLDSHLD